MVWAAGVMDGAGEPSEASEDLGQPPHRPALRQSLITYNPLILGSSAGEAGPERVQEQPDHEQETEGSRGAGRSRSPSPDGRGG
jgi:hypothetical protein